MPKAQQEQSDFRSLPVASVYESKTNPRRHFDDSKLAELVDSLKQHGILVPLLVRRNGSPGKFEIIAGARRYRAAKKAGLKEVPVRICKMTDQAVLEVQVVENLQREDVHPLEEAEGYERLLKFKDYTRDLLADKIGKSDSYITKRLRLVHLIPAARQAYLAGEIEHAHAALLCRLGPEQQPDAFDQCFDYEQWTWKADNTRVGKGRRFAVTPRDLNNWIRENIYLDLHAAPWKKDDATLLPKAGACITCPKRSGTNALLFDDMPKNDVCLDAACFQAKQAAHIIQVENKAKESGAGLVRVTTRWLGPVEEKKANAIGPNHYHRIDGKKDRCEHQVQALVVAGDRDLGHTVEICQDKHCTKHHQYGARSASDKSPAEMAKERKAKVKERIDAEILRQTFLRTVAAAPCLYGRDELNLIAGFCISRIGGDLRITLTKTLGLDPAKKVYEEALLEHAGTLTDMDLHRFVIACALIGEVNQYAWGSTKGLLTKYAALYGVPLKEIEVAVATPIWQKFDESEASRKESRAKKNPKSKARACRVCGCTDDDCNQCVEKTGEPCSWVEKDLCSACAPA